jgi:tetratricopeptide (TPR) repeat protein
LLTGWIKSFVSALLHKRSGDYGNCIEAFNSIPNASTNVFVLSQMGAAAEEGMRYDDAVNYFRIAQKLSNSTIQSIDHYAYALMVKGDDAELNKLAHTAVSSCDSNKPEAWIVVSLFCQLRSEWVKALNFIEKVCRLYIRQFQIPHSHDGYILVGHTVQFSLCIRASDESAAIAGPGAI